VACDEGCGGAGGHQLDLGPVSNSIPFDSSIELVLVIDTFEAAQGCSRWVEYKIFISALKLRLAGRECAEVYARTTIQWFTS
jgi:hypothetical protein